MKYAVLFILAFPLFCTAQTSPADSIAAHCAQLNTWYDEQSSLSPWGEGDPYVIIDSLTQLMHSGLLNLFSNDAVLEVNLQELLGMDLIQSADKQFGLVSFYANAGGTFQAHIVVGYGTDHDGHIHPIDLSFFRDAEGTTSFAGTFHQLFELGPPEDRVYLAIGGGRGCTTCWFQDAIVFARGKDGYEVAFHHNQNLRLMAGALDFSPETQTLHFYYDDIVGGHDVSSSIDEYLSDNHIECPEEEGVCRFQGTYNWNADTQTFDLGTVDVTTIPEEDPEY